MEHHENNPTSENNPKLKPFIKVLGSWARALGPVLFMGTTVTFLIFSIYLETAVILTAYESFAH